MQRVLELVGSFHKHYSNRMTCYVYVRVHLKAAKFGASLVDQGRTKCLESDVFSVESMFF
jgi:hypothetical protein